MRRLPLLWPAAILVSTAATGVAVLGNLGPPLRPLLAGWFLLFCPGMAFVRLLRLEDPASELALGLALSLATDTLVAIALLYARVWSAGLGLALLMAMSTVGATLQLLGLWRSRRVIARPATEGESDDAPDSR